MVNGATIEADVPRLREQVIDLVRATYLQYRHGQANNPPSQFMTFPDHPGARMVALPAAIRGDRPVAGMKWISSYPSNVSHGLQRASAVLILNDPGTGLPYACIEGSRVSAARTAASAALAAAALNRGERRAGRMLFVGAGVIARYILEFLVADHWSIGRVLIYDTWAQSSAAFARHASEACRLQADTVPELERALAESDVVVFATSALAPHVIAPSPLPAGQTVLHVSLRDLAPELVRHAFNVVDDAEHCLTANTSLHLAAQQWGSANLVHSILGDLLSSEADLPQDRALVFSPFGLGVLDVAVGRLFLDAALESGRAHIMPSFLGDRRRWR